MRQKDWCLLPLSRLLQIRPGILPIGIHGRAGNRDPQFSQLIQDFQEQGLGQLLRESRSLDHRAKRKLPR